MDRSILYRALSVRELVEAALPRGDLILSAVSARRLQEGTRLHRQYQLNTEVPGYQAEVPLQYTYSAPGVELTVSGRIDGLIDQGSTAILEELKTTAADPAALPPDPHYWAQVMCYGAMWCLTHEVESVTLRLIYIRLTDGSRHPSERTYRAGAIVEEFFALCRVLCDRLAAHGERMAARDRSLAALPFPFPQFRRGQRAMAAALYRAVRDRERVLIEAPTGIGKTVAALFPAVKALSEGHGERIFYLAARGTVKAVAEDTVSLLLDAGAALHAVTLTARERCCPTPGLGCHPALCPRAAGYYDRLPAALEEGSACGLWDARALARLAESHGLCPFELSLDMALEADIIICDYNYAFDPRVRLRRFFDGGGEHILLVDECHNLVDRARDMFSAQLSWDDVMQLRRALPPAAGGPLEELRTAVTELQKSFVALRHRLAQSAGVLSADRPPEALSLALRRFLRSAQDWMDSGSREPFMEPLAQLYFLGRSFAACEDTLDERCTVLMQASEPHVRVRIYCMDPSTRLAACYDRVRAAAFFSATLSPEDYFCRMLALPPSGFLRLPSPFPRENLGAAVVEHLPTAYRQREASLAGLCRLLKTMVDAREGHYFAFFPSYQYMQLAHRLFCCLYPQIDAPIQAAGMDDGAREAFLARFSGEGTLLAFAVMGGLFSEGIDLAGERLVGAAIVGVGLPQIDPEGERLREYHDALGEDGFCYAYLYPGFNRVLQAAGRVIRTARDRGTVLFIDPRFSQRRYRDLFPPHWQPLSHLSGQQAAEDFLREFWETQPALPSSNPQEVEKCEE